MARGDQLARQWIIIQNLQASRQGHTVAQLAEAVECHIRTIYRDLEALQQAGFPIYNERTAGQTRWCLMENARRPGTVPFSLTELMALYFSRDLLQALKGTVLFTAIESIFRKISATLPPETERFLKRFQQSVKVGLPPRSQTDRARDTFASLNQAIVARQRLAIEYFTMRRRTTRMRQVDPYRLWFFDGAFYLIAYCHLRRGIRVFAVDRIRTLQRLESHFNPPPDFDLDALMASSFGVFQGDLVKVKIRFGPPVAGYIQEKIWHPSQSLKTEPDGSLVFEAEVAGTEEIRHWVMQWGSQAEVLAPAALRREMANEIASMHARYAITR
jgi:predicted DNA-binding transcriptional regulator YafY